MSNDPSSGWLTTSQAAARLGVSERTVQRRCKAGKLVARQVTTDEGVVWQVGADNLPTGADSYSAEGAAIGAAIGADAADRVTTQNEQVPPSLEDVPTGDDTAKAQTVGRVPTVSERVTALQTGGVELELLAHLREENRFLRGVVEQQQRDSAELRAALREALRQRALPAPGESSSVPVEVAAPLRQATENVPTENVPQVVVKQQAGAVVAATSVPVPLAGFWKKARRVARGWLR